MVRFEQQVIAYRPETTLATGDWLHVMGLNVFPLPYGSKTPRLGKYAMYPKQWGLFYHRLNYRDIRTAFAGKCNTAVVMGRTSGNLFVIDCESNEAFRQHLSETSARNLPIFASKTPRGGHIYFRCTSGEVQPKTAKQMKNMGFDDVEIRGGSRQYVVAPPSINQDGECYQWLKSTATEVPRVSSADVDWLRLQVKSQNHPETKEYLESGHIYPEGCRNDSLYRAAHDMAFRGNNSGYINARLAPIAKFSGLERGEIPRTIDNGIRNGQQKSGKQRRFGIHDGLQMFADNYNEWRGKSGNSDREVFNALIHRSKLDNRGKGFFRASNREIAEIGKISKTTANASLLRLIKQGLITRTNDVSKGKTSLWQFAEHVIDEAKKNQRSLRKQYTNGVAYKRHNGVPDSQTSLAESKALGKSASRVLAYLQDVGEASAKTIAQALHLSIHQVYRALSKAKLRAHGLTKSIKRGLWGICKGIKRTLSKINDAGAVQKTRRAVLHRQERQTRMLDRIMRFREKTGSLPNRNTYTKARLVRQI